MADYTYTLDPSSRKFFCPECGKKRFVRFIHKETKEYHDDESLGRCDRKDSCRCFNMPGLNTHNPKAYFQGRRVKRRTIAPPPKAISYVPFDLFAKTRKRYEQNNFVQYLFTLAEVPIVNNRIELYNIGTAKLPGATIFWLIDQCGNIRTGKVMLYHPPGHEKQGKRVKEPGPRVYYTHTKQNNYFQCLFGEHLLNLFPSHPVALVESEKTAIIASIYYPDYVWLATGGKDGFTEEKCLPLKGRKVEIFPDLGCYDGWKIKAANLSHLTQFQVSPFMELNATDEDRKKDPGMDIADFLERYPSIEFTPKLLTPLVIRTPRAIPKVNVVQEAPEPSISEEQTAINRLVERYPVTSKLIERLKLDVKKVSHLSSQEDREASRKNHIGQVQPLLLAYNTTINQFTI